MVMPKPFLVTLRLEVNVNFMVSSMSITRHLSQMVSLVFTEVFLSFSRGLTDIVSYSQIFDHDGYTRFLALEIRLLTKNSHNIYYQDGSCTRGTIQFLN
ncbi:unnamed protein product [Rhizophagus irregularis]|nr:unnamed protein product [Rhizophagus irregularis]CAB4408591.1 unnamed protein product [Rhizophagus irregularis]